MKYPCVAAGLFALSLIAATAQAQSFTVQSSSVQDGHFRQRQFANVFGCTGKNLSPEISWSGAPPDTQDGSYQAHWLVWDEALIQSNAEANTHLAAIRYAQPITGEGKHFAESFKRAIEAVIDSTVPDRVARHRVQELLTWVGVTGGRFEPPRLPTMAIKVRQLIASDLANDWSALDVASTFALSEATLRRRLAEEGTTFSRLLIDARMTLALQLLQSSAQTVMQIALCVGYQTPSQFAVRFRDRFGFPPTAVRGHRR